MRSLIALAALALVAGASAQTPLPANSPFAPAGAPSSANAAKDTLELSGVSSMGKKTLLIFKDTATKKQSWVPVGETSDGITVVSYDAKAEQAVVKINGAQKILALRAASAPAATAPSTAPAPTGFATPPPAPVQPVQPTAPTPPAAQPAGDAPAKPAAPQTPAEQVKAETEARMLVSDLLEIGMAQRKAYEEAQRKAADSGNAQPAGGQPGAATQPTTTPPPAPPAAQPGGKE